jgi:hypothetical protein
VKTVRGTTRETPRKRTFNLCMADVASAMITTAGPQLAAFQLDAAEGLSEAEKLEAMAAIAEHAAKSLGLPRAAPLLKPSIGCRPAQTEVF